MIRCICAPFSGSSLLVNPCWQALRFNACRRSLGRPAKQSHRHDVCLFYALHPMNLRWTCTMEPVWARKLQYKTTKRRRLPPSVSEKLAGNMDSLFLISLSLTILSSFPVTSPASAPPFPEGSLPTKSGYLPVISNSSSALFYAFYEAQQPASSVSRTPLLVWLQGGPGCSSMLGNYFELGPWLVASDQPTLQPNHNSWNRAFGLLFIDNPIGTGFSIAATNQEIPTNQTTVAEHLWFALHSFLSSNTWFRSRPLYLTGESYAGKYVPAVSAYILQKNSYLPSQQWINLQGAAVGDGLTHPVAQIATHAITGYFTGLLNEQQKNQLENLQAEAVRFTLEGNWSAATDARDQVLNWYLNATGLATLYDYRRTEDYDLQMVGVFLNKDEVKAALGVKKELSWEPCSDAVAEAMNDDVMKSVKPMVEALLERNLSVLLYQGQFDLQDGVVGTEAWVKELEWKGLEKFLKTQRRLWVVNGKTAGYVQASGSLSHVVVSRAGHLVPHDQGSNSQAMIEGWVLKNGLFGVGAVA